MKCKLCELYQDDSFFVVVQISYICRAVTEHFINFIKGPATLFGEYEHLTGHHQAQLVCFKAVDLLQEFQVAYSERKWRQVVVEQAKPEDHQWLLNMAADLFMWNLADFMRRVVRVTQLYPERMFLILFELPWNYRLRRQKVAGEMLDPGMLEHLDTNAKKIVTLFRHELEHVKDTGCCPKQLWFQIYNLSKTYSPRTDTVEGVNSFVKLQGTKSPNISLELLSSRLTIKRKIGCVALGNFTWRKCHDHMNESASQAVPGQLFPRHGIVGGC